MRTRLLTTTASFLLHKSNFNLGVAPGGEHVRAEARPGTGRTRPELRAEVHLEAQRLVEAEDVQVSGGREPGVQVGHPSQARHEDGRAKLGGCLGVGRV